MFWSYGGKTLGGRIPPPPQVQIGLKEIEGHEFPNKKVKDLENLVNEGSKQLNNTEQYNRETMETRNGFLQKNKRQKKILNN